MDYIDYLKFPLAFIFVLAMMGLLAFALKKLGLDRGGIMTSGKKRLKVIEVHAIDTKNKAALIQCDDKQHLVLIGTNGNSVIESNIKPISDDAKK